MKKMKKTARQFDVVPVAVALQTALPLEDANSDVEVFKKRCTPAGADASQEPAAPKQSKKGEK